MSTYNIEFPKWRDEVYRKHGYDPRGWYGAEVAEKMHQEAMRTYIGPAATAKDYIEVQHTQSNLLLRKTPQKASQLQNDALCERRKGWCHRQKP